MHYRTDCVTNSLAYLHSVRHISWFRYTYGQAGTTRTIYPLLSPGAT